MAYFPANAIVGSSKNPVGDFGDGSLGDVTISTNTSLINAGTKHYNNLTIDSGKTLTAPRTIILVKNALTVNGLITATGYGSPGGAGASGGIATTIVANVVWALPSAKGGAAVGLGAPGAIGLSGIYTVEKQVAVSGTPGAISDSMLNGASWASEVFNALLDQLYTYLLSKGGGGGGGGAGNPLNQGAAATGGTGGTGGNGGGPLIIIAKTITIGAAGAIKSEGVAGSNGGNASNTAAGPGYAGGRGGGGVILLGYSSLTNNGAISVAGGYNGLINKVVI